MPSSCEVLIRLCSTLYRRKSPLPSRTAKLPRKSLSSRKSVLLKVPLTLRCATCLTVAQIYLQTKAKWEISSAELAAKAQDLTIIRERAAQQKLQIQEKTRDVERLRTRKAEGDVRLFFP